MFDALEELRSDEGRINVDVEVVMRNLDYSVRLGLPQVRPHPVNDQRVCLACSGPSLSSTLEELRWQYYNGYKVVAVNGSYDWLLGRGIRPSAHVLMDARPGNVDFVQGPAVPDCKWLLASQCDAAVFNACWGREVYLFHCLTFAEPEKAFLDAFYRGNYVKTLGGSTVGVRSLALLRVLGFRFFDVYGMDSCWLGGDHHAFDQPANRKDRSYTVTTGFRDLGSDEIGDIGRRQFNCAPWHMKQVADFQDLVRHHGDKFKIVVHGEGLIAHLVRTGARIIEEGQE